MRERGEKSWKLGLEFSLSYKLALGQMVVFYRKAKNRFVCTVVHDNIFDAQIYYYCKQVVVSILFWKQFKKIHIFFFEYCFSSTVKNKNSFSFYEKLPDCTLSLSKSIIYRYSPSGIIPVVSRLYKPKNVQHKKLTTASSFTLATCLHGCSNLGL